MANLVTEVQYSNTIADGSAGRSSTINLQLFNDGDQPLDITSIWLEDGSAGFVLDNAAAATTTLAPLDLDNPHPENSGRILTVRFDPTKTGTAHDVLRIESNTLGGKAIEIPLSGTGVSPFGDIVVEVANNNIGGARI